MRAPKLEIRSSKFEANSKPEIPKFKTTELATKLSQRKAKLPIEFPL